MHTRQTRKRAISAVLLATLSFGTAIGLGGCAPQENTPAPTPTPSQTITAPALPTNEEALAIVEELVPRFLAAEAETLQGGSSVTLADYAVAAYVEEVQGDLSELEARGLKVYGTPTLDRLEVQRVEVAQAAVVISTYGCYDITATQLLDAAGIDAIAPSTPKRSPVVVVVDSTEGTFKVRETEAWSGENLC